MQDRRRRAARLHDFCATVYYSTAECLGEALEPKALFTHEAFPWCYPNCFQRSKAAWGKIKSKLEAPAHTPRIRKGPRRKHHGRCALRRGWYQRRGRAVGGKGV